MSRALSARLRQQVDLLHKVEVSDGVGGRVESWDAYAEAVPAEVISQAGREAIIAGALQGVAVFLITLRWRDDVATDHQLRLSDGRQLNIRSAEDPDQRRERLVILADTGSAAIAA